MARPRVSVDYDTVFSMRDVGHLGWTRMAERYRELTGRFVSRDTLKRRYDEFKEQQTKLAATVIQTSPPIGKKPKPVFECFNPSSDTIEINGKIWVMTRRESNHTIPIRTPPSPPDTK